MAMARDEDQPRFCSVKTAARLLGISRSSAYNLANEWIDSDQERGLPCVRLGRRIVVPMAVIVQWEAIGLVQQPSGEPVTMPS